jgi:hypothetical protein
MSTVAFQNDQPGSTQGNTGLMLVHPNAQENESIYRLNGLEWKGALTIEDYILRENHLGTRELTRNGGIEAWALALPGSGTESEKRQLLASCETYKKKALISAEGKLQEAICYGIGSVFCPLQYRGQGYASLLLTKLALELEKRQAKTSNNGGSTVVFSALWSDIGKVRKASLMDYSN